MFRFLVILAILLSSCADDQTEHSPKNENASPLENKEGPATSSEITKDENQIPETFFQIEPKDERLVNSKIDSLLRTVEYAIAEKNLDLLFSVMDKDVISSHGGGEIGVEGIKSTWGDDLNEFWQKLEWIANLGGFFENDTVYRLPYCDEFERFPKIPDSIDAPYAYGMCVSPNTRMHLTPNLELGEGWEIGYAFALIDLSYGMNGQAGEIIMINPIGTEMRGYVKSSEFYRSSDYCLIIEKNENDVWKITSFAPWD